MIRRAVAALAALLLVTATAAAQTPARKFKRDPFDWTALQQAVQKSEPGPAAEGARPATQTRLPRLRAVMRSSSGDRANLDGVILGIGDSADGYRLVEVREYSAVFSRKGAAVELELSREQTP